LSSSDSPANQNSFNSGISRLLAFRSRVIAPSFAFCAGSVMIAADTPPFATPAPAVAAIPASQDQEQIIAQINSVLTNELAKVAAFKTTTDNMFSDEKLKINSASPSFKSFLMEDFTRDQKSVAAVAQLQKGVLDKVPQQLQALLDRKSEDPQVLLEKLNAAIPKLEANRQQSLKLIGMLHTEISGATPK